MSKQPKTTLGVVSNTKSRSVRNYRLTLNARIDHLETKCARRQELHVHKAWLHMRLHDMVPVTRTRQWDHQQGHWVEVLRDRPGQKQSNTRTVFEREYDCLDMAEFTRFWEWFQTCPIDELTPYIMEDAL